MKRIYAQGFSLVELAIVVSVLGILATFTVFAFSNWRDRTAITEVKSEVQNGASALKDQLNFNNAYPLNNAAFAAIYAPRSKVTLTYILRADGKSFCLNGVSQARPSVQWYIDSNVSSMPASGTCS